MPEVGVIGAATRHGPLPKNNPPDWVSNFPSHEATLRYKLFAKPAYTTTVVAQVHPEFGNLSHCNKFTCFGPCGADAVSSNMDRAHTLGVNLEVSQEPCTTVTQIRISHTTIYRYLTPVKLNPHRLMLRPRESRELQLISHTLKLSPDATISWAHDVSGNAVATASFTGKTDALRIESNVELDLIGNPWPIFNIAASALNFPFFYSNDDRADLGALAIQQYLDPLGRLQKWARLFVRGAEPDTLELLKAISHGVYEVLKYEIRESEGTQSPIESLDRGRGSCRDFAILFAEAVRSLDMGARIVSGYLYDPQSTATGSSGAGSTHAWAEVYVPGAGWINFDPTNRSIGGFNLVPVAVARDITLLMPVSGTYVGRADTFSAMEVDIRVT
jgi:transglutaminase-like putative cysteine protease